MREILSKIGVSIFTLVFGGFLGFYINRIQDSYANQIRHLDVVTSSYSLVSRPDIVGENLEILFNTKPIDELRRVFIDIYNRTDQDFENVPVYIELAPHEDNDFKIVRTEVAGAHNIPETITPIPNVSAPNNRRASRLGYTIATANRSPNVPILTASLLIIGKVTPDVHIETQKKGIQLGTPLLSLPVEKKWWQTEFFMVLIFIVALMLYFLVIPIVVRLTNKIFAETIKKNKKKKRADILQMFSEKGVTVTPEIEQIVEDAFYFQEKKSWEQTPKIMRFYLGLNEPKQ